MSNTKSSWVKPYVVGYYYGRSGREDIADIDQPYQNMPGFKEGVKDGVFDFQEVDIVEQAVKSPERV